MKYLLSIVLLLYAIPVYSFDTYYSPELYHSYNKQQVIMKNSKGMLVPQTVHYQSYEDRNNNVSEKIVAIYDKHAPEGAYGARYVIYTRMGNHIGYRKILQPSPNGFGYSPVYDGDLTGVTSKTPCFPDILTAIRAYYPNYKN